MNTFVAHIEQQCNGRNRYTNSIIEVAFYRIFFMLSSPPTNNDSHVTTAIFEE